nr:rna polymerase ii subunit a c-terminal domain phosphatase ssu72 [Quercus suber]
MASDPRRRPPPPPPPPPAHEVQSNTADLGVDGTNELQSGQVQQQPHIQTNGQNRSAHNEEGSFKLKFCTVCASNNNRSMEAHLRLTTAPSPYPTISFGTGSLVRLPGPSISQPNVYSFNSTSYANMYNELSSKDQRLYRANGILPMLERNKGVKWGPERWQDWRIGVPRVGKRLGATDEADYTMDKGSLGTEAGVVDVVITCEDRCWEAVVDDLLTRGSPLNRPVHVFNVDIKDNHEEALVGGRAILELADALNAAANEERQAFERITGSVNGFDAGQAHARQGFDEKVPEVLAAWQEKWPTLPALWTLSWF